MQTTTETAKTNGHAAKAHVAPETMHVPHAQVKLGKNYRKTIDEKRIDALGKDIAENGQLEPCCVRRLPDGDFELVFGERRWRAIAKAKVPTIWIYVREDLDDAKTLVLQLAENGDREDVHPLEEAEGYDRLRREHGYTAEKIAAEVSKSVSYVYKRLSLLALVPEARKQFFEGKFTYAIAELVARIPAALQPEALKRIEPEPWEHGGMSAGEAAHVIREDFMLRLDDAPFDRANAKLLPIAGACGPCPKRTGNQPELFADVKTKDTCTDPTCFKAKTEAHAKLVVEETRAKGKAVLEGAEATKALAYSSAFQKLDEQLWQLPKAPKARALLKGSGLDVIVAVDENGKTHELVKKSDLAPLVKRAGGRPETSQRDADKKKREAMAKKKVATSAVLAAIVAKVEKKEPAPTFWKFLALALVESSNLDPVHGVLQRRGLADKRDGKRPSQVAAHALRAAIEQMSAEESRGVAVELAIAHDAFAFGSWCSPELGKGVQRAAKYFGVDAPKVSKAAIAEVESLKKVPKGLEAQFAASPANDQRAIARAAKSSKQKKGAAKKS